jgi:hypothetical protein
MQTNTQTMIIDNDFSKMELLVTYDYNVIERPERIEECHGFHSFSEDEVEVNITSVEVVIGGVGIDITKQLSKNQLSIIEDSLEIYE